MAAKQRVGIVGYGHLGRFLTEKVQESDDLELAFVWNRSRDALTGSGLSDDVILEDLDKFAERRADLIVEVSHPVISRSHGAKFLQHADYLVGSPTALSDDEVHRSLRTAASHHGVYVPSGALWGAADICKMANIGSLKGLKVSMKKHPSCFRLHPDLQKKLSDTERVVLYEGPVRALCPMAPNNVNTMAAAAIAGHNLGFDGVEAELVSDPELRDYHIVEVETRGPGNDGHEFSVRTVRRNPANLAAVTGTATYNSFYSSLLGARGLGPGVHMC